MFLIVDCDTLLYSIGSIKNLYDMNVYVKIFDGKIHKIKKELNATKYLMIIQGNRNFRYKHDVNYKKHRIADKPLGYNTLKSHVIKNYKHIISHNIETDDTCNVIARLCRELNIDYTIVHIDKDLNQIIGNHYNPTKNEKYYIDNHDSIYNLCYQLLKGDTTDSKVTGLKGYGHVKATKLLQDVTTENLISIVFSEYLKVYDTNEAIHKFYQTYNIIKIIDDYPKITKKLEKLIKNDELQKV